MASEAADALMEDAARQTDIPAPHASSSSPPSSIPAADGVDVSVRPSADDGHGSGVGGVAAVAGAAGYDDDEDSGGVDGAVDGDDDDDDEDGDDDDGDGEGGAGDDGDAAGALGKAKGGSKGGSSCHQCKSRRNFVALTYCTSNLDKKSKRCRKYTTHLTHTPRCRLPAAMRMRPVAHLPPPVPPRPWWCSRKFCGHCLRKFYHENPNNIPDLNAWKCPVRPATHAPLITRRTLTSPARPATHQHVFVSARRSPAASQLPVCSAAMWVRGSRVRLCADSSRAVLWPCRICCCAACRRRKQRDTTGDDRLDGHKHKHTGNGTRRTSSPPPRRLPSGVSAAADCPVLVCCLCCWQTRPTPACMLCTR